MIIKDISSNYQAVTSVDELFGIEIEVENATVTEEEIDSTIWHTVYDGSLRNNGMEYVSEPCDYDAALIALAQFYEIHNRRHYDTSIRTSTHVHYNVLGYDTSEVCAAVTAYCIVEPLLFRVCGAEREENIYCVPWYRAPADTSAIRLLADGVMSNIAVTCKYSALYLEPLVRFGTVEFRQAPVFPDYDLAVFWINLVRSIMLNGRLMKTGEEVIRRYNEDGAAAFIEAIFGERETATLRLHCEKDFEDILDDYDTISVAEACVPSLYTYKVTDSGWEPSTLDIQGSEQEGYHQVAYRARMDTPFAYLDEPVYDEEYNEEEEW